MICQKCGTVLQPREAATGKGKCVFCIIKSYRFAIGMRVAENKKLEKTIAERDQKIADLRSIVEAKNAKIDRLRRGHTN
jgi:DNA-directed RNA polymerase subunit M/transcription elongation factor TFIIS